VDALAAGRIDRGRAWLIAERTAPLTPSLREAVQERILPIAEDRSAGNLRSLLDRAVIAADPHAAEARERKAKRDRELVMRSLPDGMASVRASAPADAAMAIFTLADLLADRTGDDDDRPVAARRVDAWHDIADQLLTHGYVDLTDLLDHQHSDAPPNRLVPITFRTPHQIAIGGTRHRPGRIPMKIRLRAPAITTNRMTIRHCAPATTTNRVALQAPTRSLTIWTA